MTFWEALAQVPLALLSPLAVIIYAIAAFVGSIALLVCSRELWHYWNQRRYPNWNSWDLKWWQKGLHIFLILATVWLTIALFVFLSVNGIYPTHW